MSQPFFEKHIIRDIQSMTRHHSTIHAEKPYKAFFCRSNFFINFLSYSGTILTCSKFVDKSFIIDGDPTKHISSVNEINIANRCNPEKCQRWSPFYTSTELGCQSTFLRGTPRNVHTRHTKTNTSRSVQCKYSNENGSYLVYCTLLTPSHGL